MTIINSLTMRVARNRSEAKVADNVSVLVPMRNEERNVDGLVTSIQASTGLDEWEFLVLNDSSTDSTQVLLEQREVRTLQGKPLAVGWLGKPWACQQLAEAASGSYLVFVDADVRLSVQAISSAIDLMNELDWDFMSPHPRQIAITFLERLFQPLLQWSWLASVPLRIAERYKIQSMTIANGQYFIVKKNAYDSIGGHAAIRNQVLDDLEIARLLIRDGFKGGVAEASALAQTRMYNSAREVVDGYTKSLWTAFGGVAGTIFAVALLVATQIAPFIIGIAGYSIGWFAYFLSAGSHAIAALRTKSTPSNIFLHPLSTMLLILLIIDSFRRKYTGRLVWRDRKIG
jgi:glycosyltransferase involved in cell wall biosynthesis